MQKIQYLGEKFLKHMVIHFYGIQNATPWPGEGCLSHLFEFTNREAGHHFSTNGRIIPPSPQRTTQVFF